MKYYSVPKCDSFLKEKHLYGFLGCELNYTFYMEHFCLKEQLTSKLWLFGLVSLADIFSKWIKSVCLYKTCNWKYLFPMLKFKISNEH